MGQIREVGKEVVVVAGIWLLLGVTVFIEQVATGSGQLPGFQIVVKNIEKPEPDVAFRFSSLLYLSTLISQQVCQGLLGGRK